MIIKEKNVVAAFLLFAQGLYFSGLITIIVYTQNYICICGIIILITKIAIILTLFSEMICPLSSRQVKYLKISTDYTYILIEM